MTPSHSWMDSAACKGQETSLFFGLDGERGPAREAREERSKAICGPCIVRRDCAAYAIVTRADGFWGGLTEEERRGERRNMMRRRAREAAAS